MWRVRILQLAVSLVSPLLVGAAALAQVNPYNPVDFVRKPGQPGVPRTPLEVAAAERLNAALKEVQDLAARGKAAPADVALDAELLRRLNVTRSKRGPEFGLLRAGGGLSWPTALQEEKFGADRGRAAALLHRAANEARAGKVPPETGENLAEVVKRLNDGLTRVVNEIPAGQYIEAKRFLNLLRDAGATLDRPGLGADLAAAADLPVRGKTVSALARYMAEKGLRFAPALPADVDAYRELERAFATYAERARPRQKEK